MQSDGTPLDYDNWGEWEAHWNEWENCAVIKRSDVKWQDRNCDDDSHDVKGYVCKSSSLGTTDGCPSGMFYDADNDHVCVECSALFPCDGTNALEKVLNEDQCREYRETSHNVHYDGNMGNEDRSRQNCNTKCSSQPPPSFL